MIPEITSPEAYELRKTFANQLADRKERDSLIEALNRKKPFRHFRSQVEFLGILEDWYQFESEYGKQKIIEWLKEEEVYAKVLPLEESDTVEYNR